jgi:sugar phosphate isomerase/epimerase
LESKKNGRWQIGCYTRPWGKYDYRVALDAIAEAGFKYAGLMSSKTGLVITTSTSVEDAWKAGEEARSRGLSVVSMFGGDIGVMKSLKTGIDGLRKLVDNCAACDCTNMLLCGHWDKNFQEAFYKAVSENLGYAEAKGVSMNLKSHGPFNATGAQLRRVAEEIGRRNFNIWYDPGNTLYYSKGKLDPVDDAKALDGFVKGMCVKDYVGPKEVNITPGTGEVDFPAVFAVLKKGGFTGGPLVVECLKRGDLKQLLVEAKKVRRFLETLTG